MKVKGINPIEQNVEKIVLGVAGAALLGVVAMQLLGGSSVEVGGDSVPLDRAYAPVKEEALRVTAQMTEENPSTPEVPVIDLLGEYQSRATSPIAVRTQLAPMGPSMALSTAATAPDAPPIQDAVYAGITVPAPAAPMAYSFRSTLNPIQVARNPELAAIVPVAQPHDKAAVTVETTFNGRAVQEMLRADPDGAAGPARPIPLRWWQDGLEVVAVRAERQTQSGNGQWSDPEPVKPLPGQMDLLTPTNPNERFNPVTIRTVVSTARQMSSRILRPDYFDVLAGQPWMPPSAAAKVEAIEARRPEIDRLRNQRREMERQIAIQQQLLEQAGGGERNNAGGHGASPPTTRQPANTTANPQVQAIRGRIATLEEQLVRNEDELSDIGVDLQGKIIPSWEEDENALDFSLPSVENPEVRLWVHDARVEPGAVYRYRMQVVFNNPFFGNAAALLPDQQSLAAEPFLFGQWSEWGQPTGVEQDRYYFVTAASVSDALGAAPRAQVEVFEFYYGFWRRGTANLSGGDVVTASLELPAPELRPIYDLTQAPGATTSTPGSTSSPNQPTSRPPAEETEGERVLRERRERQGQATGNSPGSPATPAALPAIAALATPGPESLPVTPTDAVLLDVTTLPGGQDTGMAGVAARTVVQAIFRNAAGRIETRSPDTDRTAATYRRLRQSAEEGLRQGIPEEPEEPEEIELPPLLPERPTNTAPPPGGGGGGGGGG